MASQSRGVVPPSMDRPKRIAKQLHKIYPQHSLSTCQAVTAHLYFHKDWHALEEAVKHQAKGAPFIETLSGPMLKERGMKQVFILCKELADRDVDKAELDSGEAYHLKLASDVVLETMPTSGNSPHSIEYYDIVPVCTSENVATLPSRIAQWWSVNIPHQDIVAEQWRRIEVNPNSCVSLLYAGGYWGALCHHYADTIDWTMVMGISYLFAGRYASNKAQELERFHELADIATDETRPADEQKQAQVEINEQLINLTEGFLSVLARSDLQEVFRRQPQAFIKNAEACLEILGNPNSRKGVWER